MKQDTEEKNPDIIIDFGLQTFVIDLNLEVLVIDSESKKLCKIYVINKSTQIVKCHKNIIPKKKKLEKIHANL